MSAWQNKINKIKQLTEKNPFVFKVRFHLFRMILVVLNLDIITRYIFFSSLAKTGSGVKKRVGIFSVYRPIFWHGNIFEMQFNKALAKKGYEPIHFLCKGFLDVCDVHFHKVNKESCPSICSDCVMRNKLFYEKNKANYVFLDDYINRLDCESAFRQIDALSSIDQARQYVYKDLPLGALVRLSVCRYWLRLHLTEEHLPVYKQFLRSAIMLHESFSNFLKDNKMDNYLIFNGRYATHGIPLQLIKEKKLPYSTYEFSEQERILFSVNAVSVMWADVGTRFEKWLETEETNDEQLHKEVEEFIMLRKNVFVSGYVDLQQSIDEHVDVAVFTNIVWDSGAFERETIFESQYDWIEKIIDWAVAHPQYRMTIRVHPAETNVTYNKSLELMAEYIKKYKPVLPANISVIPPEERKNSYSLMRQAKVILVYTSTIGLEAALENKLVLSAAATHYIRPGVVLASESKEDFFTLLHKTLQNPNLFQIDLNLVKKYVYFFYKIYHRLNGLDLYKKPFHIFEDSRMLRVPKIDPSLAKGEFNLLVEEFCEAGKSDANVF